MEKQRGPRVPDRAALPAGYVRTLGVTPQDGVGVNQTACQLGQCELNWKRSSRTKNEGCHAGSVTMPAELPAHDLPRAETPVM